jgi:hypothetical protein
MITIKKNFIAINALLLVVLATMNYSFTTVPGGDSFEVYLNNKLLFQQYVAKKEGVKSIQLDKSNYNDEINVYYHHCGQTGTGRIISLRDAQNKELKVWHFSDANTAMSCKVKEIMSLQKLNTNNQINLYYSSKELPQGRLLATVAIASDKKETVKM